MAEYSKAHPGALPFVAADIKALHDALKARGVEIAEVLKPRPTRTEILTSIRGMILTAEPGDRLLIVLSGHGVHHKSADYLIPSDADLNCPGLSDTLIEIDWNEYIESSKAASVLTVIDACRTGYQVNGSMGAGYTEGWSTARRRTVAEQQICYLYACDKALDAAYVRDSGGEFSIFSRSLLEVIQDDRRFSRLDEIRREVQDRVSRYTAEHKREEQHIKLRGETDPAIFAVLPDDEANGELLGGDGNPWRAAADNEDLWSLVSPGVSVEPLRKAATGLAAELWARHARTSASHDVWHDPDYPLRTAERLAWIITHLLKGPGAGFQLSAAECALLAVVPFVRSAVRDVIEPKIRPAQRQSAWLAEPLSPQQVPLAEVGQGYPRLIRRLAAARRRPAEDAVSAINGWLFQRLMDRTCQHSSEYVLDAAHQVADMARRSAGAAANSTPRVLIDEVFTTRRLAELVQAQTGGPTPFDRENRFSALCGSVSILKNKTIQQEIRERLLGCLVSLAALIAVDPAALGEIVPDHLGIGESVDLSQLQAELKECSWVQQGHILKLEAQCGHPAVEIALKQHAARVEAVLDSAHALDGEGCAEFLSRLPTRTSTEDVGSKTVDGRHAYATAGIRFHIAEDRVQELLMGEQLYRDRTLALRELYQNALDACRYRRARLEYLDRKGEKQPFAEWSGCIDFTQGVNEEGRPYIDCKDNGVGMGLSELGEVFAQSGLRFTDLPDYMRERAEWASAEPPVELNPNSRFGIGVLSYFMLAEEIVVTTCRMDRDGTLGERLEVLISGPGTLFRIRRLGVGLQAGTTVRLYLGESRKPVSCRDVLTRVLWVAEFATSCTEGGKTKRWVPGQLNPDAPVGQENPMGDSYPRDKVATVPAEQRVWWCAGMGGILADGLWAGSPQYGSIVDLTGSAPPELSVDRREIRAYAKEEVERRLITAIPDLVRHVREHQDGPVGLEDLGGYGWLCGISIILPVVGDAILSRLTNDTDLVWEIGSRNTKVSAAEFGCFSGDLLQSEIPVFAELHKMLYMALHQDLEPIPDFVDAWRRSVCYAQFAGEPRQPGAVVPVPSDGVLLADFWLPKITLPSLVVKAAKSGRTMGSTAKRLCELGFSVPDVGGATEVTVTSDDVELIEALSPRHRYQYYKYFGIVTAPCVVRAAARSGRLPGDVAARLARLGFAVSDACRALVDEPLTESDAELVGVEGPWLECEDAQIPYIQLVRGAARLGWTLQQAAARLRDIGLPAPEVVGMLVGRLTDDDAVLVADLGPYVENKGNRRVWHEAESDVPLRRVARAAAKLSSSAARAAERLAALGFRPPKGPFDADPYPQAVAELILNVRLEGDGKPKPLIRAQVVRSASGLGLTMLEAWAELARAGYPMVDDGRPFIDSELTADDDELVKGLEISADRPSVRRGRLVKTAAETGRSLAALSGRCQDLGLSLDPIDWNGIEATAEDMSLFVDHGPWWVYDDAEIPIVQLIRAAARGKLSLQDTARRYRAFGLRTADVDHLTAVPLSSDDLTLVYSQGPWREQTGSNVSWVGPEASVSRSAILRSAARLEWSVSQVVMRLRELGFGVLASDESAVSVKRLDQALLGIGNRFEPKAPFTGNRKVAAPTLESDDLIALAVKRGQSVAELNRRLVELGVETVDIQPPGLPCAYVKEDG